MYHVPAASGAMLAYAVSMEVRVVQVPVVDLAALQGRCLAEIVDAKANVTEAVQYSK
jgi:hypothetical protein